jgi:hypothetical protein
MFDEYLSKDVQEDMETTLVTQANKYMDEHLNRELKDLLKPMREELTKIAEHAVKKVIRSTTFTLRADKAPSPKQELSLEDLEAQLTGALGAKTTMLLKKSDSGKHYKPQ